MIDENYMGPEAPQHVPSLVHPNVLRRERIVFLLGLVVPMVGVAIAFSTIRMLPPTWFELVVGVVMYAITIWGIGVGYHRYFTHRTFDAVPAVKAFLGVAGCMAVQGPVNYWVAQHRYHHHHADEPEDVHTPHHSGSRLAGMLHAHCGWFLSDRAASAGRYSRDILHDPMMKRIDALYPLWLLLSVGIPAFAGLLYAGPHGALRAFLWAGLVRICLSQHMTYTVNSFCHLYGARLYKCRDFSTNNVWLSLPTLGESLHNSHHAFPSSARFSFRWHEIDLCWAFIVTLKSVGLVSNVKVPSPETIAARRV